ncbi:MAG: hypothetical protein WC679_12375 [Bacteroidales bacterium]|jgi:hypothetical protein
MSVLSGALGGILGSKKKKPSGSASVSVGGTQTITTPQGTFTYNPSDRTISTPTGMMSVPDQAAANQVVNSYRKATSSSGGGGGNNGGGGVVPPSNVPDFGGQGGSFVDPKTGIGYEVSPSGTITQIQKGNLSSSPVYSQQQLAAAQQKAQEKGFTGSVDVINPTTGEIEKRQYISGNKVQAELTSDKWDLSKTNEGRLRSFTIERYNNNPATAVQEQRVVEQEIIPSIYDPVPTFNFEQYANSFTSQVQEQDINSMSNQLEINPQTNKPYGTFTAAPSLPSGEKLFGLSFMPDLKTLSAMTSRESERITQRGMNYNLKGISSQIGLGVATSAIGTLSFVTNPVQGVIGMTEGGTSVVKRLITKQGFPEIGELIKQNPYYVVGYVGAEATQTYLTGKALGSLNKKVNFKITPKIETFTSSASTNIIKKGESLVTIGEFKVIGTTASRQVFEVKQYDILRNKFLGAAYPKGKSNLDLLDVPRLEATFPTGKLKPYTPPSFTYSFTEPFIVNKKGWITKPVRKGGTLVGVGTIKMTPTKTSTYYSSLKGFTEPIEYNVNVNKGNLASIPKKGFESIEVLANKKGIKVLQKFPREMQFSLGEIETNKLFKVSKGKLKLFQEGKRTNRGALIGVRKEVGNIEYSNEFGLKEQSFFNEKIGFVDITMPKMRTPKKSFLIEGTATEKYFELPTETTGIKSITRSGRTSSQEYLQGLYNPKQKQISPQIKKQIVSTAFTQSKLMKTNPIVSITKTPSVSKYAGLGLYERTEGGMTPQSINQRTFTNQNNLFKTNTLLYSSPKVSTFNVETFKFVNKPLERELTKGMTREVLKPLERTITKEQTKTILKPMQKITQKEMQRVMQRQVQRQTQRQTSKFNINIVVPKGTTTETPSVKYKLWQPTKSKGFGSFLVSMRRFGKFKPIGITRTQKEAFNLGKFKTATTLGATFKVEGKGIKTQNIFGYKTKPTKQGILYIEIPKYRLSTKTEKKEIQYFKRLKMKGGKL